MLVPSGLLLKQDDGDYSVPLRAVDFPPIDGSAQAFAGAIDSARMPEESVVIPIVDESIAVSAREVETGRVRVSKTVSERVEVVDEPLLRRTVEVSRVPINRIVEQAPQVRYEGETMIVPVLEEVLVVEKRLVLVEEIYLVPQDTEFRDPQQVTLRREEVTVERIPAA